MKKLLWLLIYLFSYYASAQETFSSRKALNEYIFQKTDFNAISDGYFLNFDDELTPSLIDSLFAEYNQNDSVDINQLISFLKLVELSDVTHEFEADSLLFPIMNNLYSNQGTNKLYIPIIIGDVDVNYLNDDTYKTLLQWGSSTPFPSIQASQLEHKTIQTAGVFAGSLVNNDLYLYWNDRTFISNSGRIIDKVEFIVNKDTLNIAKGEAFSIEKYYSENAHLQNIQLKISFTNNSFFIKNSFVFFQKSNSFPQTIVYSDNNEKSGTHYPFWDVMGGFGVKTTIAGDYYSQHPNEVNVNFNTIPDLSFSVLWGCDPIHGNKLDKPFIVVSGWGPFTDKSAINNAQGWPSSIQDAFFGFNQKGYFDSLVGYGYDVIIAKFYPPNARVYYNSQQLEILINLVNEEKMYNNSYQENVISGYSAGSLCTRLTLERMEHNHLQDASKPHHHCKLYVSVDGEQAGANVPLGLQHAVEYLEEYWGGGITISYALHYILNAPLSKELLRYFHTETGHFSSHGQGPHPTRTDYLTLYGTYNHSKNSDNPRYPAFTRNISLSNGTSQRTSSIASSTYYPYELTNGKQLFYQDKPLKRWQIYLLGRSDGMVFQFQKTSWGNWIIKEDAYTDNPFILDNAPGGTTFLADPNKCPDPNIVYQVLDRMVVKTSSGQVDYVDKKAMYAFTPTILTHDIRNFDHIQTNGNLYYDMKAQGLMYQTLADATTGSNASSYFGYPHLAHPANHYSNYTPFDAVFAWDQENTMHIQGGEAHWRNNGESLGCNNINTWLSNSDNNHDRWEQYDSPVREKMRSFILQEADVYNTYIQNRHYGWNANPNYTYKADIVSKHDIYIGDSVTQRTDFLPVEIEANAAVRFIACNEIKLEPGFHAKVGCVFEAKIDPAVCSFCANPGLPQVNHVQGDEQQRQSVQENTQTAGLSEWEREKIAVKLYPNPANNSVNLEVVEDGVASFFYAVYDLSGKLIQSQRIEGKQTQIALERGVYFVQIKINELCYTKKVVMY